MPVSHGIESSEERVQCGKPARGTIHLTSYHHGNQVIVEIRDDGRGIDSNKLKAKAVETAIISEEEADRLGEAGILELVFRPGLSTADQITEVSGRGVGMDVVQNVLHRLKGSVDIETRAGQGTTFRLKLPAYAGNYSRLVVQRGRSAVRDPSQRRGGNCSRQGIRRSPDS